jgi:hypothetical protein
MRRIAALWNSNWMGKVIVSVVGLLVVCCIIGVVVRPGRRTPQDTANTFATIEARLATRVVAEPTDAPVPTEVPTASPEPTVALPPPRPSGDVSRVEFGDTWPLTVEAGELLCVNQAVVFSTGGITYAVNGTAKDRADELGWQDIAPIWADGDAGLKKDMSPLIERGLALC